MSHITLVGTDRRVLLAADQRKDMADFYHAIKTGNERDINRLSGSVSVDEKEAVDIIKATLTSLKLGGSARETIFMKYANLVKHSDLYGIINQAITKRDEDFVKLAVFSGKIDITTLSCTLGNLLWMNIYPDIIAKLMKRPDLDLRYAIKVFASSDNIELLTKFLQDVRITDACIQYALLCIIDEADSKADKSIPILLSHKMATGAVLGEVLVYYVAKDFSSMKVEKKDANLRLILDLLAKNNIPHKVIVKALEEAARRGNTKIVENLYTQATGGEVGDCVMAAIGGGDANAAVLDILMKRKGEISFLKLNALKLFAATKLSAPMRKKVFA